MDKKTGVYPVKTRSRLCRSSLLDLFKQLSLFDSDDEYGAAKARSREYQAAKRILFEAKGFRGWVRRN
jgi:hypothetical protein